MTIHTIGHSTRPIEEFISLLRTNGVNHLVDVRTVPGSRYNPQFNQSTLPGSLEAAGIAYSHIDKLGGLRHSRKDVVSVNMGWRNKSFRNYADYMQTEDFAAGLDSLIHLAGNQHAAIMCSEAVPWRCHRSLISDALTIRGIQAAHIMSPTSTTIHSLIPFAEVDGLRLTYPA